MYLKKELYELLHADESIFNYFLDGALDGIWYWDLGNIENEWMNARFWTVLGYNPDEMPHKSSAWQSVINQDDLKVVMENFTKHCDNPNHPYDQIVRYTHKNGSTVWIRCRGMAIRDENGKPYRMLGTHHDITELKQAEEKFIQSERTFRDLFNGIDDSIFIHEIGTGAILDVNDSMLQNFGYDRDDVSDLTVADLSAQEALPTGEKIIELFERAAKGETVVFEWLCRRKNGDLFYSENILSRANIGGVERILAIVRDVTERKQAALGIKESEKKFRFLADNSVDVVWQLNRSLRFTYVSPSIYPMTGYTQEEWIGTKLSQHSTFKEFMKMARRAVMALKNHKSFQNITFEAVMLKKDGSDFPVEISSKLIYNEKGFPVGLQGTTRDITERRQAEEALRKSEERFRVVQDMSPDGFTILNPLRNEKGEVIDFTWVYQNQAVARINGTSPEGVVGKRLLDLFPTHKGTAVYDAYLHVAITGETQILEDIYVGEIISVPTYLRLVIVAMGEDIAILSQDITERKRAEQERMRILERVKQVAQHLPGFIYQYHLRNDNTSLFPYASDGIVNIYGITPEEAMRSAQSAFNVLHPDDLNRVSESINKSAKNMTKWQDSYRVILPSGKTIWVEGNATPSKLEDNSVLWHGYIQDITERKRAEKELEMFKTISDNALDGKAIADVHGNLVYINDYFARIHGYNKEELIDKHLSIFHNEIQMEEVERINERLIKNGYFEPAEVWHIKRDGTEFPMLMSGVTIKDESGNTLYLSCSAIDISMQKQVEQVLKKAKEKAEQSDRLKSAFLANMSHEIRTPMNGILGFAELLKQPDLTGDQQQKYISIINKSGARMLNIINEIVDISKIEAGLVEIHMNESNINKRIEDVCTFFKPEAENKNIKLSYVTPLPAKDVIIKTDREKVYAVLANLVKNAIKYTEKGEIELGYNIVETHGRASLQFYVKDTGIGIPKERQEAIFERFIQADIADTMARQGAGLGLTISKAYVEMLGGKIWVESEEGIGSTFYFTLPYNTETKKETKVAPPALSGSNDLIRKLKILIVEDEETSALLLDIQLAAFGKETLKVRTGTEAVEACKKNPDIDLVLMDIQIPEMNGYEATKKIREFNEEVIIIAQTAYGLSGDREKAIHAGCNDYIAKPIEKDKLVALIQKYFKK